MEANSTGYSLLESQILNTINETLQPIQYHLDDYSDTRNETDDEIRLGLQVTLSRTRFATQQIIIPVFITLGIIGNIISIAVWSRRSMRSCSSQYITAFLICEVLYLMLAASLCFKADTHGGGYSWYIYYQYPIGRPLADTFSNCGVWLTVIITINRWIFLSYPQNARVLFYGNYVKCIIIAICFFVTLLTFPEFFQYKVIKNNQGMDENTTNLKLAKVSFATSKFYNSAFVGFSQTLFTFMPLISLVCFNFLLINSAIFVGRRLKRSLHKNYKFSRDRIRTKLNYRQAKKQKKSQRLTLTLIAVVIVFIVCHSPQAILNLYISYLEYSKYKISDVM